MKKTEIQILPATSLSFNFRELWDARELLFFFTWRDIKVKYKQTSIGILWAMLQPLLLMILFYLIFSRTLKVQVGSIPYPVYTFAGLLLWGLFSSGISNSSESMLSHAGMIRKIYFPRLIIPLSSLLVALIDFAFAFIVLIILLLVYRQPVSLTAIICFPAGILLSFLASMGIGLLLAALNVKYRDFRYVLPFTLQLLFFASQIVYSIHSIATPWLRYLLYCNPFNGAMEIFRYPMDQGVLDVTGLSISLAAICVCLAAGLFYFRKTESFFADLM